MRVFRLCYNIISHKFYAGQGLHLNLQLTNRRYNLKLETIWQDHGLVEISGLTGIKNYIFQQHQLSGLISDKQLDNNDKELIQMTLKLPEYSSFQAEIIGSIQHVKTFIDPKFKGEEYLINILSKGEVVKLGSIQAERFKVRNLEGKTSVGTLVGKDVNISSKEFEAGKLMANGKVELECDKGYLRSLLLQESEAIIKAKNFVVESIQGKTSIKGGNVKVGKWYAGNGQIDVEADEYELVIEAGTGVVKGKGKVTLGKQHKGKFITEENNIQNIIQINN